jgi:peptidoglycan-N-acetylglucosamine deacetylase
MDATRAGALAVAACLLVVAACGRDRPVEVPAGSTSSASSTVTVAPGPTSLAPTGSTAAPETTSSPVDPGPATIVSRGTATRPVVALTFDAGSDVGHTQVILDTLAATGVTASFGITGAWARAHPALVARIALAGHQLLNHSDDHPSFTGLSTGSPPLGREARLAQLQRAEEAIRAAAGVGAVPWFRPPYGDVDQSVAADVWRAGFRFVVLWTVDSLGWRAAPAEEIVERCLTRSEPGAIYLFHVGSASADAVALPAVIDGLRAQGYGFATVAGVVPPP